VDDACFSALPERKGEVKVRINPDVVPGGGIKKIPSRILGKGL
jgi:hypothetical protein